LVLGLETKVPAEEVLAHGLTGALLLSSLVFLFLSCFYILTGFTRSPNQQPTFCFFGVFVFVVIKNH
jgi:O-antigen ligase